MHWPESLENNFPLGISVSHLLRNGWCAFQYGTQTMTLYTSGRIARDGVLRLVWKTKECTVACTLQAGSFPLEDPTSALLPVLKNLSLTFVDAEGTCNDFAHKVGQHITGKTFKDCLLYWVALSLERRGNGKLQDFFSVDVPCLVVQIDIQVGKSPWLDCHLQRCEGPWVVHRCESQHVLLGLFTATEETWYDRVMALEGQPVNRVMARFLKYVFEFAWEQARAGTETFAYTSGVAVPSNASP